MQAQAKVTSKGQITVPREVRRLMGVRPGDRLLFESDAEGIRVRPVRTGSPFAKYRGIRNPGMTSGRRAIARWLRDLRGR
jgi:AbrB family looped-hinge helix DNA binding protein